MVYIICVGSLSGCGCRGGTFFLMGIFIITNEITELNLMKSLFAFYYNFLGRGLFYVFIGCFFWWVQPKEKRERGRKRECEKVRMRDFIEANEKENEKKTKRKEKMTIDEEN